MANHSLRAEGSPKVNSLQMLFYFDFADLRFSSFLYYADFMICSKVNICRLFLPISSILLSRSLDLSSCFYFIEEFWISFLFFLSVSSYSSNPSLSRFFSIFYFLINFDFTDFMSEYLIIYFF